MPKLRAVLFDLGGTLVDERDFAGWTDAARRLYLDFDPDELAHAYQELLTEIDAEPPIPDPEARVLDFWRRTLSRAAQKDVTESTVEKFVAAHRGSQAPLQLYSDTRRCLEQLRSEHRMLGVISNSTSEARVRQILDRVGILDYFARVVSSGTEGVEKPNPEIFHRAVRRMNVAPAEALYVGNLAYTDAKAAQSAGLWAVWLNREGFGFGEDPPEITSLLEVPLCVQRIESGRPIV
jgi:putative hydrolase of the HAD superfamily